MAKQNESVLISGFAYPVALDFLETWSQSVKSKHIILAPVSAVADVIPNGPPAIEAPALEGESAGGSHGRS
jgi:polysaccharide deacetylase 2 family uncharacterized protein YibQ